MHFLYLIVVSWLCIFLLIRIKYKICNDCVTWKKQMIVIEKNEWIKFLKKYKRPQLITIWFKCWKVFDPFEQNYLREDLNKQRKQFNLMLDWKTLERQWTEMLLDFDNIKKENQTIWFYFKRNNYSICILMWLWNVEAWALINYVF